jgi:hypothetical protein
VHLQRKLLQTTFAFPKKLLSLVETTTAKGPMFEDNYQLSENRFGCKEFTKRFFNFLTSIISPSHLDF